MAAPVGRLIVVTTNLLVPLLLLFLLTQGLDATTCRKSLKWKTGLPAADMPVAATAHTPQKSCHQTCPSCQANWHLRVATHSRWDYPWSCRSGRSSHLAED